MLEELAFIQLPAGMPLFVENAPGDRAYLIKQGEIEIFVNRGDQVFVLARRGAGEIIGEMALIDQGTRSASARAVCDSELVVLTARQFAHRVAQTDPILRLCLGAVIERYRATLSLYGAGTKAEPVLKATERELGRDFKQAIQALTMERELERAIQGGEFELYFQPIVELRTSDLAGFEALIRWNHPVRGVVPPMEFIPLAEASGLICGITTWCLNEVARTFPRMASRARERPGPVGGGERAALFICVNVSNHDLLDPGFGRTVRKILDTGAIAASELKLEITESVLMNDPGAARLMLQACRRQGIGIAIDDFGTGYSNLSYLSTLPITTLKIDRAFVEVVAQDGPGRKIVSTIRHLAHELGIPVVAEGIETPAQAEALIALNCDFGQGYLFGRPLALDATLGLIASWPRPARPGPPRLVAALRA